ncbi:MAG: Methyltransferase type 12 [Chthoniobacteraceae bacterium]|nr:Methyltransferase type 12 [Chthoniobacteraceae bacterium]
MNVSAFYAYQTAARGLNSLQDVLLAVRDQSPIYDDLVSEWLPEDKNSRIYEVACGSGIFLHWLKNLGYKNMEGSDSSEAQILLAQAGGLPVKLADSIGELRGRAAGSLDCIVGLDFYEHLPKEVFLDFISECHRTLAPGGRLILRGPNGDSPVVGRALFNDITHYWALTTTALTALLQMTGFHKVLFKDDTLASIRYKRWIKLPFAWLAQHAYRTLIRLATRENIRVLSSSMFFCAWK